MRFYADQYQKYWSARNLACLQAPTGRGEQPAASVGLTPALPRRSRAGHGEGVAPHRPYAMAGGFGALVGDAALPSATRPTDVPRVDVGQVDVWQADVRDVRVDVAGHAWHLVATFGGAPPSTRWPTSLRAGPGPGTRFLRLDRAVLRAGHRCARITRRSPNTEAFHQESEYSWADG